jgi:glycine/D-amino acid oxidase-like deaminating enzyme
MQKAMFAAVDEVIDVADAEKIDAQIRKDGMLHVATNPAQAERLRQHLPEMRRVGWGEDDLIEIGRDELARRIRIPGALCAHWSPHGARIQPALLAIGLAEAVERLGVDVFEHTRVTEIRPGATMSPLGTVRADFVVRATEGFTANVKGHRRDSLPMNSSMIVTAPLPQAVWDEIGWQRAELVGDGAHSFCYMQRTEDGRIVVGGRGVPYRFGSRTDDYGKTHETTVRQLREMLRKYYPVAGEAAIDHTWSGVLGVPRDWCASVRLDRGTGLASAGGYVGHGVAGTNLAGRTLRDLILRRDTELTRLPWVDRPIQTWEPEPLRWIGVHSLYVAYRAADRKEFAGATRTPAIARIAGKISGR